MKKIISITFLALVITALNAQNYNVLEDVRANLVLTAGMERPYSFDNNLMTPAPKSYKPFYISHYGRHGSRYAWSTDFYTAPLKMLTDAHEVGQLTEFGESFLARLQDFYLVPLMNYGDLVPLGWEQHQKIAAIMYDSFPEVFKGNAYVEAVVSTSSRAIVSMSSFCLSLKEKNPKLSFYQSSTHTGMMIAAPSSAPSQIREKYKGFEGNPVEGFETREEFGARVGHYPEICAKLFKDKDFPDRYEGGKHEFVLNLFGLICGYHNYEERPLFDDLLNADEMIALWLVNNYSSFLYDIDNRWLNIPLLKDIILKADRAISGEGCAAADLRFGHDYVIEAFNALIDVNGCGKIPATPDEVKYWVQSYSIPKAANDQFIFYRSKKNADILFKLLLNGKETVLPQLTAVSGPYYRWDDFKAWAEQMMAEHPLILKGNKPVED